MGNQMYEVEALDTRLVGRKLNNHSSMPIIFGAKQSKTGLD